MTLLPMDLWNEKLYKQATALFWTPTSHITSTPTFDNQTKFTLWPPLQFTASDILKIILAIVLPPLGVFFERGCGADLLINILLTVLGYIPGIIHALYIILKY
ncbi:unnamed protein product [Rhizoctonia solani]|uniref:Plasma membrane proteolipid 3 n=1 Tax=Rhizoctonia solani TaxID=456999 RepID=A0A8H2XEZ3_9AGAM|nr:unnamed protein product [Rhizoctonia solani]